MILDNSAPKINQLRFILYCLSYSLLGAALYGFGPLIPYYAQRQNRQQTDYALILIGRIAGYILGSATAKITEQKLTIHQNLVISLYLVGVFLLIFNMLSDLVLEMISMLMVSVGLALIDIFCNVGTVVCFRREGEQKYLQIMHGCTSIGGIIVPFIIYLIDFKTFPLLAIIAIILATILCFIPSPEIANNQSTQIQINNQGCIIPSKAFIFLCAAFIFIFSIQTMFGAWVSTYSVQKKLNTKQGGNIYSVLFFLSMALSRFIFANFKGNAKVKINILSISGFISAALFLVFGQDSKIALILISAFLGLCIGPTFALFLIVPKQDGYELAEKQISNIVIVAVIGQGFTVTMTGQLMGLLAQESLFYSLGLCFILMLICHQIFKKILAKFAISDIKNQSNDSQMNM